MSIHLTRTTANTSAIDALATATGGRVGLGALVDDLDRQARRTPFSRLLGRAVDRAFTWDKADRADRRWWPQGITSSADADDPVLSRGRRLLVTSWYSKTIAEETHGCRVSVIDLATLRYRHVLLVVPTLKDGRIELAPLKVHAGGLVWCGRWLHVAATGRGFVTCNWDDLLRIPVPTGDTDDLRLGDGARGVAALGYRYVLPVRFSYRGSAPEGGARMRYSFLSLDRTGDGLHLVAGEYGRGQQSRRVARFPLDPETSLLAADTDGVSVPLELDDGGVARMQGAVVARGRWHATASVGPIFPGSVYVGHPGQLRAHHLATPIGPEDLTYWPSDDLLWSVTEHPHRRWVYAMRRAWFD